MSIHIEKQKSISGHNRKEESISGHIKKQKSISVHIEKEESINGHIEKRKDQKERWEKLRDRFARVQENSEEAEEKTEIKKKEILKNRAQKLAKNLKKEENKEECIDMLLFFLKNGENYEQYGVEAVYVSEVLPLKEITSIPCTPSFVLGIINVRGKIISVVDLRNFLGLGVAKFYEDKNKIIIVKYGEMEVGLLSSSITEVARLPITEIQGATTILESSQWKYFKGITKKRVLILDLEKFLTDPKLIVNEEVSI